MEYYQIFIDNGYATENDMNTVTESDCIKMGITKNMHIKLILMKNGNQANVNGNDVNVNANNGHNINASIVDKFGHANDVDEPEQLPTYGESNYDQIHDQLPTYSEGDVHTNARFE